MRSSVVPRKQQQRQERYVHGLGNHEGEVVQGLQHDVLRTIAHQSSSGESLAPKSVRFPSALIDSIQRVHGYLQATCESLGYTVCIVN